jgi:hypothetical protein
MENPGIFYDHFVYFPAIENIVWPYGIFCGHLVFFPVLVFGTKKNLATLDDGMVGMFAHNGTVAGAKLKTRLHTKKLFFCRGAIPGSML